jgi:hypothetical protein
MIWIATTKDGKMHEVQDFCIGKFVTENEVIKCQLKR